MNYSDQIWQLMARALNQEATTVEWEELSALLKDDAILQQQYELLTRIWQERENVGEDDSEARATVQKIIHKAEEEGVDVIYLFDQAVIRRRRRRNWVVAASAVIVLTLGIVWMQMSGLGSTNLLAGNPAKEALVAQKGSRTRSMLPDGTTVWLNAGSELHFVSDFNSATREVRLDGEAYFDVAKKEGKPFIVHTGGINIKVLGTAFNVKSYPEDKNVETTLYHGRVQVYRPEEDANKGIDLRPNQKLILPKQAAIEKEKLSKDILPDSYLSYSNFVIAPIDSTKKENERFETAWLFSRLEFRGDNFEELSYKLERWYNVNIAFADENVKRLNFNGSFEKESIEEAFAALRMAVPYFTYKIDNNDISVASSR